MTYDELYDALLNGTPVKHWKGSAPFAVHRIVPTGEERLMPEFGALVQLARPGVEPFRERGAVLVPVRPAK